MLFGGANMIDRKSPIPLYQQLFTLLKQKIVSGTIPVGTKLPGEDEIVDLYNVSRTTVRQAIESLVQEGLVCKQQGRGTFVIANRPKRIQNQQNSKSIAFLLPDLTQQHPRNIAATVISKVESYLQAKNFNLVLSQSNYNIDNENLQLKRLAKENAGIIWLPEDQAYRPPSHFAFQLVADGYPLILYDKTIKGLDTGYVLVDNYSGISTLVQHLVSLGHKRIGFYGTLPHTPTSVEDRFHGYLHTIAKNGLTINYDWVIPEGNDGLHKLMLILSESKDRPTAIVAKDDVDAFKVIDKAISMGFSIPEDLSVTGFDDLNFSFSELRLTTARQDPDLLGTKLAEQIVTAINASIPLGKVVLPAPIIAGNTTAPPPKID